jgi:patatin-related protein
MVAVPQEELEDREDLGEPEELRLALVMNGGVSLAIWMGGVTVEINRLMNRDGPYGDVLRMMNTSLRVDVIAGASAGGINGAMLATMIAHDSPRSVELDSLREIWLEQGALRELLRSPLQKDPPSLLRGDEFFLPRLREVFDALMVGPPTAAAENPVRLTLTTTLMKPSIRGFADDFGSLIADPDHRGEFTFQRGPGMPDDFDLQADGRAAEKLALAARSTASFPVAFEPSYVPVDKAPGAPDPDPDRPDMRGSANFDTNRFCVDGGVLVNKPFEPAIRGIFAQQAADERIRRVLAYIVPDPGVPGDNLPQRRDEVQTIAKVGVATGISLPRVESVARELEEIAGHNRRVQAQRQLRDHLLAASAEGGDDVESLARALFDPFVVLRSQQVVDRLTGAADLFDPRFVGVFEGLGAGAAPWDTERIRELVEAMRYPWVPAAFPSDREPPAVDPWTWGTETVEWMGGTVLNMLNRALQLTDTATEEGQAIVFARMGVHTLLADLRAMVLRRVPDYWGEQSKALQERLLHEAGGGGSSTDAWQPQSFEDWLRAREPGARTPGAIAQDIGATLARNAPTCRDLDRSGSGEPDPATTDTARAPVPLGRLMDRLVPGDDPSGMATLRRLLALAVVRAVTGGGRNDPEQLVELLQVSATAPNAFDARRMGSDKLAGLQLGHFGAFYKRSWRANDWMWGRLDGAARLAQLLLDPARLRSLGWSSGAAADRLERAVFGDADPETRAVLGEDHARGWNRDAALRELAFLDDPAGTPPKSLPRCALALARRLQLQILQDELPQIADAVEHDIGDGATERTAEDFLHGERSAEQVAASRGEGSRIGSRDAVHLFGRCRVGAERVTDEAGSDLFTITVTTAAGVGVTALAGSRSGLPRTAKLALGAIRTSVLTVWLLARNAVSEHRTGFAVTMFLFAAAGALLAIAALSNAQLPGFLAAIGTVILLAGVLLALLRAGVRRGIVLIMLIALVVAVFLTVPSVLVDRIDADATGALGYVRNLAPPVFAVVGLVLGGVLLGLVHDPGRGTERAARARSTSRRPVTKP